MNLDDKLGPISRRLGPVGRAYHHIDDEVHRYHETIVKRWEDDGHERRDLALGTSTAGALICATLAVSVMSGTTIPKVLYSTGHWTRLCAGLGLMGHAYQMTPHLLAVIEGKRPDGILDTADTKIINNPALYRKWRTIRGTRLTALAIGATTTLAGGVQAIQGLREKDAVTTYDGLGLVSMGLTSIFFGSTAYIIDREPSLLDRAPAWKRALDSVKEYFAPSPTPVPAPVHNYLTTDVRQ